MGARRQAHFGHRSEPTWNARHVLISSDRTDPAEKPPEKIARQKQEAEDSRVSQEKARVANKAVFRP